MGTSGLSPQIPNKYLGPNVYLCTVVNRNREPTGADYRQPETGKLYPINCFWQVTKDPTTGVEGEIWVLSKIVANVAYWVMLSTGGSGPLLNITVDASTAPGTNPVVPSGIGNITITGAQVATGTIGANVIRTNSIAANEFNVEIQRSTAVASTDSTKNGVSHFNSTEFTVNSSGFVSLSTGPAISSVTGDDSLPVVPTAGNINVTGVTVANGTNVKPLYFKKNATSTEELDIQLTTTSTFAARNINNAGISSFDSTAFTVAAATGFVQLAGGTGPATQTYQVDNAVAPGVNPVVPSAAGLLNVFGGNGIETDTFAANTITISNKGAGLGVTNLGISYSSSTFSICSQNGTALSTSNPAFVTIPSKSTPGISKVYKITANQSFIDSTGVSNLLGNNWGAPAGDITGTSNPLRFYIYAACNSSAGSPETTASFFISRVPCLNNLPVAGKIAKSGSAVASTQGSVYSLNNITVADYASSPCICIGAFLMTKSSPAGVSDWAVYPLSSYPYVGIGEFLENLGLSIAVGTFGAASGKYILNNGGTAPAFLNAETRWYLDRKGFLTMITALVNNNGNGAGGVSTLHAIPYLSEVSTYNTTVGTGQATLNGVGNTLMVYTNAGSTNVYFLLNNSGSFLSNNSFIGTFALAFSFTMKISED